jgi:hypothetical protein
MTTQIEMSLESESWAVDSAATILTSWPIGKEFTADDLHGLLSSPPHHNAYGTLLHHMARKKLIEQVGYDRSVRPERNGGLIRRWRVR